MSKYRVLVGKDLRKTFKNYRDAFNYASASGEECVIKKVLRKKDKRRG